MHIDEDLAVDSLEYCVWSGLLSSRSSYAVLSVCWLLCVRGARILRYSSVPTSFLAGPKKAIVSLSSRAPRFSRAMLALVGCLLVAAPSPREASVVAQPAPADGEAVDQTPERPKRPDLENDPHARDWYPHGEVKEFCKGNLVDRGLTICCNAKCGKCGGSHCANAPGGARECCHEDIMHGRGVNYCVNETQTSCVMPLTCELDQCLPMCPLHPGCSVIWANRGLDYAEVRKWKVRQMNVYSGTQSRDTSLRAAQQPQ